MRLSPRDLYILRRTQLLVERKALAAQFAQHSFKRLILEMERRYGLLDKEMIIDIHTGIISEDGSAEARSKTSSRGEPGGNLKEEINESGRHESATAHRPS